MSKLKLKKPSITIKIAQSFDGKIAAAGGKSRWITGIRARKFVHELRAEHDAILVGKNTFKLDRPRLTSSRGDSPEWKIIFTSSDMLPFKKNSPIFEGGSQVVFVVARSELGLWMKEKNVQNENCLFLPVKKSTTKGFNLEELMDKLFYLGIRKLLVEGGGEVFSSFFEAGLADRIYWMMAPKVIGGRDATTAIEGKGIKDPNKAIELKVQEVFKLGQDFCFQATLAKRKTK